MKVEILAIILSILALITYVVRFIKGILRFRKGIDDPNQKQDTEILLIKKDISQINENISTLKKNHIDHIEKDIRELIKGQVRIETLLTRK